MTIASTTNRVTYTGNGTTTNFSFPYLFLAGTDLKVYQNGVLKTLTTHYTVSGAGNPAGGTVTFLTAPASGDGIVILNDPPLTQTLDLEDNDALPAETLERALDRLTIIAQRLADQFGRTVRLADSDLSGASTILPTPAASAFLAWNEDGDELINVDASDVVTIAGSASHFVETFDGNGATTVFSLSGAPGSVNNLEVFISGVRQRPTLDYTLSGTTLTFLAAPAAGTDNILVKWTQTLAIGDIGDGVVTDAKVAANAAIESSKLQFTPAGTGAKARTVQDKLRDVVNVLDFGAAADGSTDDTTAFVNALDYAIAQGKTLFIPGGEYVFNGFTSTGQAITVSIEGEAGNIPVLRPTQAAVDDGNYMFLFCSTRYSTVSGLTLTTSIKPNQQVISLADVTGIKVGDILHISSNQLWYNGNRGVYYRGEIHKIIGVDAGANTVTIEDFTRDAYATTDTLTIRAFTPNKVSIKNLRIEAPYPATAVTSVGIALQQCDAPIVENVWLKGFRNTNILDNLNWNARFINVHFENDEDLDTSIANGYGIETNGSVGTLVDGLYTKGLRRAFDAGSISGTTEAAVARDWRVKNFIVRGGGAWFPNTAEISYGIGMHGSSENGTIEDGHIQDCHNGITARGRNTKVHNVTFSGSINNAVSLHEEGAGLEVKGCTYDSFNYPNKFASLADVEADSNCGIFVRLGVTTGGAGGNCFYDLPIVIENNTVKGVKTAFVQFSQNGRTVENLRVVNNHIEAIPGAAGTFYTFYAPSANTNIKKAIFDANDDYAINGTVVTWGTNLVLGYRDASEGSRPVVDFKIDGSYYVRLPTDTVARIPRVAPAGQRIVVIANADAGGSGFFRMTPENATLTTMGVALPATWKGTATGSSLTGSTGSSGDVTFGLMNNGDLYIENRAAGTYTFRLTIQ